MIFPLVSNEKTALTVKNFIKEQRIPHAILILGDSGVGKHTLADFLAKAIVCGKSDAPCDMCDNCRLADSKNHPDIITVAPEDDKKSIVISQIRELRQEAFVRPHKTLKKVFIIDKADTMNSASQNALLKVLEEPPSYVTFIICVTNKEKLLQTVLSRSQVVSFFPLPTEVVEKYLLDKNYDAKDIKTVKNRIVTLMTRIVSSV